MFTEQDKKKYACAIALQYIPKTHRHFDDVVQEGLLGFLIAEKKWSDTPGGMPALACGRKWVAGRMFRFFHKAGKHNQEVPFNDYDTTDDSSLAESEAELQERMALLGRLHIAMICLPETDRKILNLSYFNENKCTQLENAHIMGVPETTYYNHLRRAKQRLRSLMDEYSPCEIYPTT